MPFIIKVESKLNRASCYAILFILTILSYWPLSLGIFSVKNDNIQYFLPFRYNISAAIQHGELPFWSPFIYLGFPLHGDMQSGAWNPIVWFFACFTHYNITVLHVELLLYIFVGGIGAFKLAKYFTTDYKAQLFVAVSYLLSGYMYNSAQFINWIASAAFIPFVFYNYYGFLKKPLVHKAVKTAIFYWLLLVCGYPSDFIYVFYILISMTLTALYTNRHRLTSIPVKLYLIRHLVIIFLFAGLAAPALISFIEYLPYHERGNGITLKQAYENSYEIKNLISILNPWPTWATNFSSATDPTGRNFFFGIIPICFFGLAFLKKVNIRDKFLLFLTVFSFLFCLGEGFGIRQLSYHILPGMESFRHPSHFRLYVILFFLLFCVKGISYLKAQPVIKFIIFALIFACLFLSLFLYFSQSSLSFIFISQWNANGIKAWLMNVSYVQLLVLGLSIQIIFLVGLWLICQKSPKNFNAILLLHMLNLFTFQSVLPTTLVSKTPPATINHIIDNQPLIPTTATLLATINENSSDAMRYYDEVGRLYLYNKKLGITQEIYNPSNFRRLNAVINTPFLFNYISRRPIIYSASKQIALEDSSNISTKNSCNYSFIEGTTINNLSNDCSTNTMDFRALRFGYNYIKCRVINPKTSFLNLTQNYYHHWQATIDGKPTPIQISNYAFMSVKVPAGKHEIEWIYKPFKLYWAIAFAILTALLCLFLLYRRT